MLDIVLLLGLGLLLGLEHSLDADHVAAIATISSKSISWKKAATVGIYWGFGHTAILLLAGIIILNLEIKIPQPIEKTIEIIVGLMLIFFGIKNLIGYKKEMLHTHGEKAHIHIQKNNDNHNKNHDSHISFWIGAVHGLAGSATITLMILATIQSKILGIIYIAIFGAGSILGMGGTSLILRMSTLFLEKKYPNKYAQTAGGISILAGTTIIFKLLV